MKQRRAKAVTTTVATVVVIVALIVGVGIGYAAGPLAAPAARATVTRTTTATVTGPAPAPVTVTSTVRAPTLTGEIPIGAVLTITGDLASYGKRNQVAVQLAEKDINDFVKASGLTVTFKFLIEDDATNPAVSLQKVQALAAKGVKVIIGPMFSGGVRNVKGYADANKILLVSPSSTAPELAIPNDYVFRLVPDDIAQNKALARLVQQTGVTNVVLLWRADAWGDGLASNFETTFAKLGGTVVDKIRYSIEAKDYAAELSKVASGVQGAITKVGKDKVAVVAIAFDELAVIYQQAKDRKPLLDVIWFGSDGTAQSSRVSKDAGAIAAQVKSLSTLFAPTDSPKYQSLKSRIKAAIGEDPDVYAVISYDAAWVTALSVLAAGKYDGEVVRAVLPTVSNSWFGASGWVLLNEAGDRAGGDYEIWQVVRKPDGTFDWDKVGVWSQAADRVTFVKTV